MNNVILKSHVRTRTVLIDLHSSLLLQKTYYRVIQCHRSLQKTPKKKIIICCSHQKRRLYAPWKNQCHSYILRNYCRFLILRCLILISAIPLCVSNQEKSCDFMGILIPSTLCMIRIWGIYNRSFLFSCLFKVSPLSLSSSDSTVIPLAKENTFSSTALWVALLGRTKIFTYMYCHECPASLNDAV